MSDAVHSAVRQLPLGRLRDQGSYSGTNDLQDGLESTGEPVKYDDSSRHFRFTGTRASCQLEAQVEVPSIGFSWKSDPLNTSKCDFAILGDEVNGRYYDS